MESQNGTDLATPLQDAPAAGCPFSAVGAEFNPFYGEQLEDPYPFLARARREEPVFYSALLKLWYVTRYDDIVAVIRDPVRFSSSAAINVPIEYTAETRHAIQTSFLSQNSLTNNDPPSHTRIRRMVNKAFTARQVTDLEGRIRVIANDLIDRFAGDGHVELVQQFSFLLPMRVILSVIGAPEEDLPRIARWVDEWTDLLFVQFTPEKQAEVVAHMLEYQQYWADLVEARRSSPRDDLISALIQASHDEDPPVPFSQLLNVCAQLTVAGRETTAHLFSTLVYRLLSLPDQWRLVCEDPANIPKAIEEVLRADTSVHALMRMTTEPVELNGVKLPKGAWLAVQFSSANHDEAYFPDADRFDLQRKSSKGHLAFGQGIHYCVGAPLARTEMRIALGLLIRRLPGLRFAPDQEFTHVMTNPILRGLKELRLEWDAGRPDGEPRA